MPNNNEMTANLVILRVVYYTDKIYVYVYMYMHVKHLCMPILYLKNEAKIKLSGAGVMNSLLN